MSVVGLGIDLVEVEPFAAQLNATGTSFLEGTFSPAELRRARDGHEVSSTGFARHLAARFAAKEAFVKAWSMARAGMPPAMHDVHWTDICIESDDWGRPSILLGGETAECVADTLGRVSLSVSLTHEDSVAGAVVVISPAVALPPASSSADVASSGEAVR